MRTCTSVKLRLRRKAWRTRKGHKWSLALLWVAERGQSVSEIVVGGRSVSKRSAIVVVGGAGLKC